MRPKALLIVLLLLGAFCAFCVYVIAADAPGTATATVTTAVVPQGHYVRQCGPRGCTMVWVPNIIQTVPPTVIPSLIDPLAPPCNCPGGVCATAPAATAAAPVAVVPVPRTPIRNAIDNSRYRRAVRRWRR